MEPVTPPQKGVNQILVQISANHYILHLHPTKDIFF